MPRASSQYPTGPTAWMVAPRRHSQDKPAKARGPLGGGRVGVAQGAKETNRRFLNRARSFVAQRAICTDLSVRRGTGLQVATFCGPDAGVFSQWPERTPTLRR